MRKLLLIVGILATACSGDSGTRVAMIGHEFDPPTLTVSVGDTVVWANQSDEAHTVTARQGTLPDGTDYFSSGNAAGEAEAVARLSDQLVDPGDAYEYTFDEPGTYRYYCIPHDIDGMRGTIVVEQ